MRITLAELVQRFDTGEIRLPLMQREYVWKPRKVVRLLDSLYRKWPVGSFYVWQTQDSHPSKARFGRLPQRKLDGFYGFLLDGQQRLTSLSLAVQGEAEGELAHRGFFDVENEQFYLGEMTKTVKKRVEAADPMLVPLSALIDPDRGEGEQLVRAVERAIESMRESDKLGRGNSYEVTYRERLHRVATMLTCEALCEEFTDDHEEHAFELFSRLNKGGTSLVAGEVEAARLASAATKKIVEPMRAVVNEKEMRAMGVNFVFLLRTLVTVHRGNCSFAKLPNKWADDAGEVEASWAITEEALRATIEFARKKLGWTTRRWLPSTLALIPIVYLFAKGGSSSVNEKEARFLQRYLLITGLRSLFRSSTETTVNRYVSAVRDCGRRDRLSMARALFERVPKNRLFAIKSDDIRSTSGPYSPLMQVYLAFLYDRAAKSWPSGRGLRDILNQQYENDPVAVHHIFPKKFMEARDFPVDRLNTAANYAIISQPDNAELADRDPFLVWRSLKDNQRDCASEQLFFTATDNYLRAEAYDEFVEFRSKRMAECLNEFLWLGGKASTA